LTAFDVARERNRMANPIIELDPVTHITAGAIGKPGQRTFFIQAEKGLERVTLVCEKEQVVALADAVDEMVVNLEQEFGLARHEDLKVDDDAMHVKARTCSSTRTTRWTGIPGAGGAELEARAAEDKPILLSVGYSACHWCHVMAHESFEDEETARLMNELFVNIKVDREERPDVDAIYMEAVQAMTGQRRLADDGLPDARRLKPFYGGTYFPPEALRACPASPGAARRSRRRGRTAAEMESPRRAAGRAQPQQMRAPAATAGTPLNARAAGRPPGAARPTTGTTAGSAARPSFRSR
jgi:hypothetical protein